MTTQPRETILKLSPGQKWIVVKALMDLTSPYGIGQLMRLYPDTDLEKLDEEIDDLCNQLNPDVSKK